MNQADRIRQVALESFVLPTRAAGLAEVTIRAGDLHTQMKLRNAMPAVCSVLRSKFEHFAGVTLLQVTGPQNGANVYFRFGLAGRESHASPSLPKTDPQQFKTSGRNVRSSAPCLSLQDAVVLVSCVKSKLTYSAPARILYCSDWFTKVRGIVEAHSADWFVLSALYGLVPANMEIAPYEHTLNTVGVADRQAWAAKVYQTLVPVLRKRNRVVFFAGLRYQEFLIGPLERDGFHVEEPMEGLAIGEQLAWLSAHQ